MSVTAIVSVYGHSTVSLANVSTQQSNCFTTSLTIRNSVTYPTTLQSLSSQFPGQSG